MKNQPTRADVVIAVRCALAERRTLIKGEVLPVGVIEDEWRRGRDAARDAQNPWLLERRMKALSESHDRGPRE